MVVFDIHIKPDLLLFNTPLSNFAKTKEQNQGWEDKFPLYKRRKMHICPFNLDSVLLFLHNNLKVAYYTYKQLGTFLHRHKFLLFVCCIFTFTYADLSRLARASCWSVAYCKTFVQCNFFPFISTTGKEFFKQIEHLKASLLIMSAQYFMRNGNLPQFSPLHTGTFVLTFYEYKE